MKNIKKFILVSVVILCGLILFFYNNQVQKIEAKPDDGSDTPVVIDRGTTNEYQLPYDSTSLFEPKLLNDSNFEGYVQSTDEVLNVYKQFVGGISTPYWNKSWVGSVLDNGDIITIEYEMSYPIIVESKYLDDVWVVKRDSSGNELARLQVPNNSGIPAAIINEGVPLLKKSNGNYILPYSTQAVSVSTNYSESYFFEFTSDLNYVSRELISNDASGEGTSYYVSFSENANGTYFWHYRNSPSSNSAKFKKFNSDGTFIEDIELAFSSEIAPIADISLYEYDDYYVGKIISVNASGNSEYLAVWDKGTKEIQGVYKQDEEKGKVNVLTEISDSGALYFIHQPNSGRTNINVMKDGNISTIKLAMEPTDITSSDVNEKYGSSYPEGTQMDLKPSSRGFVIVGYVQQVIDQFDKYSDVGGQFYAFLNKDFKFENANIIKSDGELAFTLNFSDDKSIYIGGNFDSKGSDYLTIPIDVIEKSDSTHKNGLYGKLNIANDYSPAIKAPSGLIIDLELLPNLNQDELDNLLISGEKDGSKNSIKAIKVFDSYDIEENSSSESLLFEKINRNPNALTNTIDWEALGFDNNGKVGPNRVTYFITDSQRQTTSTSRIVNKIDSHTVVNKEGALAAYNFAITLDELVNLTDESLRNSDKYANLTAWDLDTGESILSLPENEGIEIDAEQLADIKAATEFGVYPLTFKLNYGEEYKEVAISVFVSRYEPIDDYVYDLEPISMPWDVSKDISGEDYPNSEFSKDGIHVYTAYKISTGEKIDENNPNYQLIGDVTNLNACDPNPNDYTATEAVKVPVSIWTRGATPTKEVDLPNTPDTTVYYRTEDIKVSFVDWNFATLYDVEGNQLQAAGVTLANQIVGKNTAIKTNAQVVAAIETILLKGYEKEDYYLEDKTAKLTTDSVLVELNNGDGATYYLRFKGLLEIISVPTVDFGLHNTATAWGGSLREDAPDVTGSLIISDTRADTTKNWTLKAELSEPLTSLDGSVTIPDAIRYKRSGQSEFVLSTEKQIMMANDAGTFGTFDVSETWGSTKDSDGFKFEAPAAKVKKLTKYQATIKYTLSDTYEP
ncbi:WxL domain-containing protein [Enterococcus sp. BWR-S5]|uniref:WxL domain-containing protein n=1 Tax=Enterococcus sp. BWR-S5 TaxID=2787714 RepID=UPI001922BBA7|nr:WxL domain-containing protein [Enterococcus sp. BWR-S5]MBL1226682.1 WxL domain-containing protein [Enterococcus sp. BWR-S5]